MEEEPLGIPFEITPRALTAENLEAFGHFLADVIKDGLAASAKVAGCPTEFESLTIKHEGCVLHGRLTFRRVGQVEEV